MRVMRVGFCDLVCVLSHSAFPPNPNPNLMCVLSAFPPNPNLMCVLSAFPPDELVRSHGAQLFERTRLWRGPGLGLGLELGLGFRLGLGLEVTSGGQLGLGLEVTSGTGV